MSKKIISIVAGGTAGHVFPAQAISKILGTTNEIIFFTDKRGAKYFEDKSGVKELSVSNISGNIFKKIFNLLKLGIATLKCIYLLRIKCVKLAIGFGGLTSFPVLFAAKLLKIPIILHEQNAVLGKANRFFVKDAQLIATSFRDTIGIENSEKAICTGNPIRSSIFDAKRRRTRITKEIQILVIGGSQGATLFDNVIPNAITQLPVEVKENIIIYQQGRDISLVKSIYSKSQVRKYIVDTFFHDIPQLIADSDLVISRAGAAALSEIDHLGVPAIVIPMANSADNHQLHNAREYEKKGGVIVLENHELLFEKLEDLLVKDGLDKLQRRDSEKNNAAQKLAIKINEVIINLRL